MAGGVNMACGFREGHLCRDCEDDARLEKQEGGMNRKFIWKRGIVIYTYLFRSDGIMNLLKNIVLIIILVKTKTERGWEKMGIFHVIAYCFVFIGQISLMYVCFD